MEGCSNDEDCVDEPQTGAITVSLDTCPTQSPPSADTADVPVAATEAGEAPIAIVLDVNVDPADPVTPPGAAEEASTSNTSRWFVCYVCLLMFGGAMTPLQGCLFAPLQEQLNVSELTLASVYASRSIAFCAGSIITSFVVDVCVESHRFTGLTLFSAAVAIACLAFVDFLPMQYVLWSVIGFAKGLLEVIFPVFVFRAFRRDTESKWFALLMVAGVCKMATPLINQLSISLTGQFSYGMFAVALSGVLVGILMLLLPTPRHDKLRSIKKAIVKEESVRDALAVEAVCVVSTKCF